MGHTNQTANYNLPQFVGTDKPSWLGDINDAFAAIDTAIAAAASEASTADGKADGLITTVSGHTTQIGLLENTVTSQGNTLNTVTSLIGNGTPTTTDQTIIGAINELHTDQGDLEDLQTTDKSSLVAAINEVAVGGYIEVSGDNVKTASQLLDTVFAQIDSAKLKPTSTLTVQNRVYQAVVVSGNEYKFSASLCSSANMNCGTATVKSSGSTLETVIAAVGGATTYVDTSSGVWPNTDKIRLTY